MYLKEEEKRTCPPLLSNSSSQYTKTRVNCGSRQAPLAQESEKGKKPRSQILVEVCGTFNRCMLPPELACLGVWETLLVAVI